MSQNLVDITTILPGAEETVSGETRLLKSNSFQCGSRERGISVTEVVMVLLVVMILLAIGIPQLMNAIYVSRIRGTADDVAGLVQQARILAEQQNTTLAVYTGTVDGGLSGAFVNCYRNGTSDSCGSGAGTSWASGMPDIPFTSGVTLGSSSSAPGTLSPGFTPEAAGTTLYFSPRGLPVKSSGVTYVASNGVIFYLTDTHGNWAAVSVSGAGRSKVWAYTGTWH
jgi:Tfp pilus assembly protein FimT